MTDQAEFERAVLPYAQSHAAFRDFDDPRILFLPNPNLSRRSVSAIARTTVMLYESRPSAADNSRWVAFLPEGAVSTPFHDPDFKGLALVNETDWRRLRAQNRLP